MTNEEVPARFPEITEIVEAGKLHLSALVMLSPHLTPQNHEALLSFAEGKSEAVLEKKLAELFPKVANERTSKVRWLSGSEALVTLSVPASLIEKLERLAELRKKAHPHGERAVLLEEATRKCPGNAPRAHARHIRRGIRTEVVRRDEGACVFVGRNGKRCGERAFIEVDHKLPWALGGSSRDPGTSDVRHKSPNSFMALAGTVTGRSEGLMAVSSRGPNERCLGAVRAAVARDE